MSTGDELSSAVRFQYKRLFFWLLVVVAAVIAGAVLQYGLPDQIVALADAIIKVGTAPWCSGTGCR